MPRLQIRIIIVLAWAFFTGFLFYQDILPAWMIGEPPTWKTIAASARPTPSRWLIMAGSESEREPLRVIGLATSSTTKRPDQTTELKSHLRIDAKGLFRGTPLAVAESTEFQFDSTTIISPQGLLDQLRGEVHVRDLGEKPVLTILVVPASNNRLEIRFQSEITPFLNFRQILKMSPESLVRGGLEPVDFLPGLQVGQRWNTRILQPLTARSEDVTSEVKQLSRLFWAGNPVDVFVVEHKSSAFTAKTYVRPDGLVIRQQLPTPFVNLTLEREPESAAP